MRPHTKKRIAWVLVSTGAIFGFASPAFSGITIIPTFDTTITSDPNAAAMEAGINAALSEAEAVLQNPITVKINFQTLPTGLADSSWSTSTISYSQYLSDLQTKQTRSASDNIALATLPNSNPLTTGGVTLALPVLRALGESAGANSGADGTVSLNMANMNLSRTGAQNPNLYDLQTIAMHQIDDVLGIGATGSTLGIGGANIGPEDLFRYKQPGVRSYSVNDAGSYFSIDGGVTNIDYFSQNPFGDYADWVLGKFPEVQDAVAPKQQLDLGSSEITAFDVIGYDLVPEPSFCGFMVLAAASQLKRCRRA